MYSSKTVEAFCFFSATLSKIVLGQNASCSPENACRLGQRWHLVNKRHFVMAKFKTGQWIRIPSNFNLRQYRSQWARIIDASGELLTLEVLPGKEITAVQDEIGQKRALNVKERYAIMERDGFKCQLCGRDSREAGVPLQIDHKTPWSRGGKTSLENLWTLCRDCNLGKGTS